MTHCTALSLAARFATVSVEARRVAATDSGPAPPMRRIRASQLLVAISIATSANFNASFAVASPHIAGANVSSYDELKKAVDAGTAPILITSERIVFPTQLLIENTTLTIESIPESHTAFRAYLDGGDAPSMLLCRAEGMIQDLFLLPPTGGLFFFILQS